MIPKIIHYCWFGNKQIPEREQGCMATWEAMLSDYQIMRWDENNFDVNSNPFTKEAYRLKKYAFVADYVRLHALTTCGGIYLDTDIEIVKSFDELLEQHKAIGGFETPQVLQTGMLACEKHNDVFEVFFAYYKTHQFVWGGESATPPNSAIFARLMMERGLKLDNTYQKIDGVAIYPQEYFCPIDQGSRQIISTENTYCIHYLMGSWFPRKIRWKNNLKRFIGKYVSYNFVNAIRHLLRK